MLVLHYQQHVETHRLRLRIRRSQARVLPSAPLKILQMGMWRFLGLKPSGAPGLVLPAWAQIPLS